MKIKTSELEGAALDWAVAKCEGYELNLYGVDPSIRARVPGQGVIAPWKPTTNWAQSGPIIEREKIQINPSISSNAWGSAAWGSANPSKGQCVWVWADTPLVAAMRCYVASKLGDRIEIPDELFQ